MNELHHRIRTALVSIIYAAKHGAPLPARARRDVNATVANLKP